MKKILLLFTLALSMQIVQAHKGGHGLSADSKHIKDWHLVDNSIVATGYFLLAKDGKVFIETSSKIVPVEIEKLLWADKNYVKRKIKHIAEVNAYNTIKHHQTMTGNGSFSFNYWMLIFLIGLSISILLNGISNKLVKKIGSPLFIIILMLTAIACGDSDEDTDPDTSEELISATSDAATLKLAFDPYSTVTTSSDATYFYVESNGIPEHQMMVGITAWIAQVPIPKHIQAAMLGLFL